MRNHRLLGALAALGLCLCMPHGTAQAYYIEVYYKGSDIRFGLAPQRIVCDADDALQTLLTQVRTYAEPQAYEFLRKPRNVLPGGSAVTREEIRRLPGAEKIIKEHCRQSTDRLLIMNAIHMVQVDGHMVTTVLVMDTHSKPGVTYLIDCVVLDPLLGSKEYAQLKMALDAIRLVIETPKPSPPPQRGTTDGVWRPVQPQ